MIQDVNITRQPSSVGANPVLWSLDPVLSVRGTNYLGRIFIEVWDNHQELAIIGADSSFIYSVLSALKNEQYTIASESMTTSEPTHSMPGSAFLGRVVVETWDDKTVVGMLEVDEDDHSVWERATRMLIELSYGLSPLKEHGMSSVN
jgi:hypothetical protein